MIEVCTDEDFKATVAAREMCDLAGNALATAYPGYRWRIEPHPHPTRPFLDIILEAGDARCAIAVRTWEFYSASSLKAHIVDAGGELLERYGLNRRAMDEAEMLGRKRGPLGLVLPEC